MKGYVDDLALLVGGAGNRSTGGRNIIGEAGAAVAGRIARITRRKNPSPDMEESQADAGTEV
jgi:hypothetical protein